MTKDLTPVSWRSLWPVACVSMPTRKPGFQFLAQALSKAFRGKFMAALAAAHQDGKIGRDPQGQDGPSRERQRQLYQHDWVVYAKTPLGGPAQVLKYLSRYTHCTVIGNERIRAVIDSGVAFSVRAADHGANCNAKRSVRLDSTEFVRRFMLHVQPTGIKRIRHYGAWPRRARGQAASSTPGFANACTQPSGH